MFVSRVALPHALRSPEQRAPERPGTFVCREDGARLHAVRVSQGLNLQNVNIPREAAGYCWISYLRFPCIVFRPNF